MTAWSNLSCVVIFFVVHVTNTGAVLHWNLPKSSFLWQCSWFCHVLPCSQQENRGERNGLRFRQRRSWPENQDCYRCYPKWLTLSYKKWIYWIVERSPKISFSNDFAAFIKYNSRLAIDVSLHARGHHNEQCFLVYSSLSSAILSPIDSAHAPLSIFDYIYMSLCHSCPFCFVVKFLDTWTATWQAFFLIRREDVTLRFLLVGLIAGLLF